MSHLRRSLIVVGLLLSGLTLGCSSNPQANNGTPSANGGKAVPINPHNPKKVLTAEPQGPAPPPIRK